MLGLEPDVEDFWDHHLLQLFHNLHVWCWKEKSGLYNQTGKCGTEGLFGLIIKKPSFCLEEPNYLSLRHPEYFLHRGIGDYSWPLSLLNTWSPCGRKGAMEVIPNTLKINLQVFLKNFSVAVLRSHNRPHILLSFCESPLLRKETITGEILNHPGWPLTV